MMLLFEKIKPEKETKVENILLYYCSAYIVPSNSDVQITDFGKSWRSGLAFNYMIHKYRPDLVDIDSLAQNSARTNLENAFSTAETHLGIPRLLDPEGSQYPYMCFLLFCFLYAFVIHTMCSVQHECNKQ